MKQILLFNYTGVVADNPICQLWAQDMRTVLQTAVDHWCPWSAELKMLEPFCLTDCDRQKDCFQCEREYGYGFEQDEAY